MIVAVIPVKDEPVKIVKTVVSNVSKYVDKIIVVDSSKKKIKINNKKVVLLREELPGKGRAIRKAISFIKKNYIANYVVFIDSDGERTPEMIPKMIEKLKLCDMVICNRTRWRSTVRRMENAFSSLWINNVTGYSLRDPNSGYFSIRMEKLQKLNLTASGFEIEMDFVLNMAIENGKICEVYEDNNTFSKSKFRIEDLIKLNYFFDNWCLKNRKKIRVNILTLYLISIGFILSKLFIRYFLDGDS